MAPRARGPATNFSIWATAGSEAKPRGSTATSSERALTWPRATWLAPSTGYTPRSTFLGPPPMTAPLGRCACGRGLRTTVPVMPEASSALRIASPAASLTASASPLPSKPAHASAAASVAWRSPSPSSPSSPFTGRWGAGPEGPNPAIPLLCCSMVSAGGLGFLQQLRGTKLHLVAAVQERRLDEIAEKRMRPVGSRAELRVELAGNEPGVVGELDDLDQAAVRREPAEDHPGLAHHLAVLVVELEAVTMPLVDDLFPVRPVRVRTRQQLARVQAEPHRASQLVDVALLGHEVDDRRRGERRELGGVRVRRLQLLPREVDHSALHAQAQAQVRDAVAARVSRRLHLALDAAVAESARDD